jgi:hypothetical protein
VDHSKDEIEEMIELLQLMAAKNRFPETDIYTGCCASCGKQIYPDNSITEFDFNNHEQDCQWRIISQKLERYAHPRPNLRQNKLEAAGLSSGENISWWMSPDTGRRLVLAHSEYTDCEYAQSGKYGLRKSDNTVHGKFTEQSCQKSRDNREKFYTLQEAKVIDSEEHGLLIETGEYRIPKPGEIYKIGQKAIVYETSVCQLDQLSTPNAQSSDLYKYSILEQFSYQPEYRAVHF